MEQHFSAAAATAGRVIMARIFPDLDVLETLGEICAQYGVRYGKVDVCIGSLRRVSLNYVSTANPAPGQGYTTRLEMEGAFTILCGQGVFSPAAAGEGLDAHLHMVISGQRDAVYGGHVLAGTRTLTTTDLCVTELAGVEIRRRRDEASGVMLTSFHEVEP